MLTTDANTVYATYGGKTVITGTFDKDYTSSEKPEGGDITSDELALDNADMKGNVIVANTPNGDVTDINLSITDTKVEKDVIAGQAGEGTVTNTSVTISGDKTDIEGTVAGGRVDIKGTVTNAIVKMAGGEVNEIKGGFAKAGEAIDNVVDLIKGEVETVFGGNVESKDGKSLRNKVNLLGATVTKIFGGACDTAEDNVTKLIKGTVKDEVYAGHGEKENINNVINIGSETQSDLSELHLETATLYGGKQGNDVKNEGNTLNVYGKTSAKVVVDFDNYNFYNVKVNDPTAHLALTDNVDLTDSKISVELAKGTNLTVGDTVNLISTQGTLKADNAAIDAGLKAKSGAVLEYSFGLDNVNNNSLVATAKTAEASGTLQDLSLSQLSGLLATKQTTEMVAYKDNMK